MWQCRKTRGKVRLALQKESVANLHLVAVPWRRTALEYERQ
jgi:hypothetical protein